MNGIINVLKPPMMTSQGVVSAIRRITGEKHTGHTGTLDPNASGVLPVCLGKSTKLAEYLLADEKEYIGELLFGIKTDSLDTEGEVTETTDVIPTADEIASVLSEFTGELLQKPPAVSALRINGKRAYELAKNNEEVDIPARKIIVHSLELLSSNGKDRYIIRVACSKGTYIRSLARDIGERLNSLASLSLLVRTKCGIFDISNAYTLEQIEECFKSGRINEVMINPNDAMENYPYVVFPKEYEKKLFCGNALPLTAATEHSELKPDTIIRIITANELIAIGKIKMSEGTIMIQPEKVIAE